MSARARLSAMLTVFGACAACGGASTHRDADSDAAGATASSGDASAAGNAGSNNPTDEYGGPGTVTEEWGGFCVATFSVDFPVTDPFERPLFTARGGERYLLTRYNVATAELLYLTPSGPISFEIDSPAGVGFPFVSSCAFDPPKAYFGVFADVSVYAEPELVTKSCDLNAGEVVPRDAAEAAGYALDSSSGGDYVYEIFLNAFSQRCGGADSGYVSVSRVHVLGTDRALVPFAVLDAEK